MNSLAASRGHIKACQGCFLRVVFISAFKIPHNTHICYIDF